MSSFERNGLLHDTLRENREYEAFRELMFKKGLAEIRKKRAAARFSMPWAVAASVVFGIALGLWGISRRSEPPQVASVHSVDSFLSRPLATALVVRSKSSEGLFVRTSKAEANLEMITTEQVPLVELSDQELLAALGNKPVGFVQNNGHLEFMELGN
jgi:hypothetical protein